MMERWFAECEVGDVLVGVSAEEVREANRELEEGGSEYRWVLLGMRDGKQEWQLRGMSHEGPK